MAEQSRIWEHFQNQSLDSFKASSPCLDFLLNHIHSLAKGSQPKVLNIGVGSYWKLGDLSVPVDVTKKNLSDFKNVKIHQGSLPEGCVFLMRGYTV